MMKIALASVVVVMLGIAASAPRQKEAHAKLIVPGKVALRDRLPITAAMEVALEWNQDDPVSIPITKAQPNHPAEIIGTWKVFYADGKEVEQAAMQAVVPYPDGLVVVRRGEKIRMTFTPVSAYYFTKQSVYRVLAQFTGTTSRGTKVTFICGEEFFQIDDAKI